MRWNALILLAFSVACSSSDTTRCGELRCAPGAVCLGDGERCVSREQVASCRGLADGENCAYPGVADGRCLSEICEDAVCGNGELNFAEVCDDGNTEGGDGCSADCRSDESCGNGTVDAPREQCDDGNQDDGDGCQSSCLLARCGDSVVDPGETCDDGNLDGGDGCNQVCTSDETCGNGWTDFELGEQCDDAGLRSRDGCSSSCTAELPIWSEKTLETRGRRNFAAAYDSAHGFGLVFGGVGADGGAAPGTLLYRFAQWQRAEVSLEPPLRSDTSLSYDAARRETILFGGNRVSSGQRFGDTWAFDGDWRQLSPATSPSARGQHAAAWDALRSETIVFGGQAEDNSALGDTWVFDGTSWSLASSSGPAPRHNHFMAYDAGRGVTVLFGGQDEENGVVFFDTWEWDGSTWTEVQTAITPPGARGGAAYHPELGGVMAFGGVDFPDGTWWVFDGVDWTELTELFLPRPEGRQGAALFYDASQGEVVVAFGLLPISGFVFLTDTWGFNGSNWVPVDIRVAPRNRALGLMSYDSLRGETLYYGGTNSAGPGINDLWRVEDEQIVELVDQNPPDGGFVLGFVFHEAIACHYLFRIESAIVATYELCGRSWRRVSTATQLPFRAGPAFAYDPVREKIVLFGGNGPSEQQNDTWEFDGSDWQEVATETAPPARESAFMAYHRGIGRTVLFGGRSELAMYNDTWVYDGSTWSELLVNTPPPPRFGGTAVYYRPRDVILFHGGQPLLNDDTYEFNGTQWSAVFEPSTPPPRSGFAIAYDDQLQQVVMVGGGGVTDSWEFAFSSNLATENCELADDGDQDGVAGCLDPDCDGRVCGLGQLCVQGSCSCARASESSCRDGFDEDCDGLVDCADPDCATSTECMAESDCGNGIDDDGDGLTDCQDAGCAGLGVCEPFETSCGDGQDNDSDGQTDCEDLDCFLVPCMAVTR